MSVLVVMKGDKDFTREFFVCWSCFFGSKNQFITFKVAILHKYFFAFILSFSKSLYLCSP